LETSLPYSNYVGQFSISAENGWSQRIKPQTDAEPVGQFFPPTEGGKMAASYPYFGLGDNFYGQ
jgi:hypothetical protein